MMTNNFEEFRFDLASLARPRKPGISAYMRLKNERQFLRLVIESHLPFYDEIIAVYNDCTDDTPDILRELATKHLKIKMFHYEPKVHQISSEAHRSEPTESVHSMANYYNYALSKCNYAVATKLDGDHLAIPCNLIPAIEAIRADISKGKRKLYYFSGINLVRAHGEIMPGGLVQYPFSGQSDISYHPVNPQFHYRQGHSTEKLIKPHPRQIERVHLGQLYFHLHHIKSGRGVQFGAMQDGVYRDTSGKYIAMPFNEFRSARNLQRMVRRMKLLDRIRLLLCRNAILRKLPRRITGHNRKFRLARMLRLADDLRDIDFQRDALDWLK